MIRFITASALLLILLCPPSAYAQDTSSVWESWNEWEDWNWDEWQDWQEWTVAELDAFDTWLNWDNFVKKAAKETDVKFTFDGSWWYDRNSVTVSQELINKTAKSLRMSKLFAREYLAAPIAFQRLVNQVQSEFPHLRPGEAKRQASDAIFAYFEKRFANGVDYLRKYRYPNYVRSSPGLKSPDIIRRIETFVRGTSRIEGHNPGFNIQLMYAESSGHPRAFSVTTAWGLWQFVESTWRATCRATFGHVRDLSERYDIMKNTACFFTLSNYDGLYHWNEPLKVSGSLRRSLANAYPGYDFRKPLLPYLLSKRN